jgi:Flp pilus assembly protein TadG
MKHDVKSFLGRLRGDRRGAVFVYAAASALALLGFGAIVVDVSYIFHAKRVLQASTDAAALAGATTLSTGTPTTAVAAANTYSAASGDKNANANLTITATPQTVNCTGHTGTTCTATTTNPNGIKVSETATVPTYFARALGINSVSLSTSAYALQSGGQAIKEDIMIILDTTASMNSADASCSGATRENCALAGFRTLLAGFSPPTQEVGLMVFPGLDTAASAAAEYDCSSSTPTSSNIAMYNASANPPTTTPPVYLVVPLSSDYNTGGTLNTSSNLVKAARGGATGCTAGLSAIGGAGTFYADAITAAQNYLTANGRTGVNKMIILLSDGDASASATSQISTAKGTNECHEGITAAASAKTAGTTVITIAYGAPGSGSCSKDTSPSITACQTMLDMATVGTGTSTQPQWFFSDTGSACTGAYSASNLNSIFTSVGSMISSGGARLIPSS